MEIGKVPETILERSVFKQLNVKRKEVLIGPGIGEDCAVLSFEEDECVVLSVDPITATADHIGELAVHITLNDLASSGAEPVGLLVSLLLPDGYSEGDLKMLMKEMGTVAKSFDVQIIGGHTEVTGAVNQPIVTVTGVGKTYKNKVHLAKNIKAGMDIVMTKSAGIEGTSILGNVGEEQLLTKYSQSLIKEAKSYSSKLSVVADSKIAMKYNVYAMHDVTEGGILGALWELGSKANLGLLVDQKKIPITQATIEICEFFDINPYKLIGSGSLLIITDQGKEMVEGLGDNGIQATIIGQMVTGNHKQVELDKVKRSLMPAKSDELYKALERL